MGRRFHIKDLLLNSAVIFISYLLAVVIRYRILRSEPGINALSTPYLVIACTYSLLIAFTFDYEEYRRWFTGRASINSLYQILSKNAIGCLFLLSAFYMTGIVFFSRWALFLFWIISSFGLIVKREIIFSRVMRKRAKGLDPYHVVVIGDGDMTRRYINSVNDNPQFGIHICGYFGKNRDLETNMDIVFDKEEIIGSIIQWFGEYDEEHFWKIIDEYKINEILIADHGMDDETIRNILVTAHSKGIHTNMTMHYSSLIVDGSRIRNIGMIKLIALNEKEEEKTYYPTGMVMTSAMLFLIMMVRKFNMGALDTMKGFENYRCVIFALFGFFLYLSMQRSFEGKKQKTILRSAFSWCICTAFIIGYELIYNINVIQSIRIDLLITTIVLVSCTAISLVMDAFDQSDFLLTD